MKASSESTRQVGSRWWWGSMARLPIGRSGSEAKVITLRLVQRAGSGPALPPSYLPYHPSVPPVKRPASSSLRVACVCGLSVEFARVLGLPLTRRCSPAALHRNCMLFFSLPALIVWLSRWPRSRPLESCLGRYKITMRVSLAIPQSRKASSLPPLPSDSCSCGLHLASWLGDLVGWIAHRQSLTQRSKENPQLPTL